ncbi:MAG: TetR/AcrR family transcriptional regulator C-terminal domain-containing protein [Candidatus Saccharimonadaceae bacterium]
MNDERWIREQKRLDDIQRRMQEQFARRQRHISLHLDKVQERINKKYGKSAVSDDMRARIIREALQLLTEDGLDKLSLRRLAQRVNIQAPALYWYFKDKATLVDYLAEGILQSEFGSNFQPRVEGESWQEWLRTTMMRLRLAMLAYPDGGRVVAGAKLYPAETLAQIIEYSLESLITAGVSPEGARTAHTTAMTYTFGFVIEEQAAPRPEEVMDFDLEYLFRKHPYIHRMMQQIDLSDYATGVHYENGLNAIISGSSSRL